jgi:hypothetical protein
MSGYVESPMPPFWLSIALLSLSQGALVALAGDGRALDAVAWIERRQSRLWAAVPPLSVLVFVLVAQAAARASASSLTYLALVAVPILAVLALGWLARGARPVLAPLALVLFALAWADGGGLAGEAAALALSALSCVALGVLLAAVTPARWLVAGIVLMACADTALVLSELLQHPNEVLTAAHPAAGLPRLQAVVFGSAAMGYGDLFVAGVLGGLLARGSGSGQRELGTHLGALPEAAGEGRGENSKRALGAYPEAARKLRGEHSEQLRAAALVAVIGLVFDLLFFAVDVLPATVPVALALVLIVLARRRGETGVGETPSGDLPTERAKTGPRGRVSPRASRERL